MKRKYFGTVKCKVYGGKDTNKTLGIHIPKDNHQSLELVNSVVKAIEYGKDIDITIYKERTDRKGNISITITSRL